MAIWLASLAHWARTNHSNDSVLIFTPKILAHMRGQQQQKVRRGEGVQPQPKISNSPKIAQLAKICRLPSAASQPVATLKVLNHINTLGNVLRRAATLKICVKPSNEGSEEQQQQNVDRKSCSKAHDNAQQQREKTKTQREKKRKTQHSA